MIDNENRLLIEIYLDGSKSIEKSKDDLKALGLQIVAEVAWYRHGVLSAYAPVEKISSVGRLDSVSAVHRALRAHTNAGQVLSEGVSVHKTDVAANLGYNGAGVTVGVLSDSFDANTGTSVHAAADIAGGDLPGPGNPAGYTIPVNVIKELPAPMWPGTDEGRAMCQIVHDLAPAATIAFATAFVGAVDYAVQMQALKDDAGCQVIVDDVHYLDEPYFSDGLLGQQVDSLAAAGVAYFSAADNAGNAGHVTEFHHLSDAEGRQAATAAGLNLSTFVGDDGAGNPVDLSPYTSGGWHNFTPHQSSPTIAQQYLDLIALGLVIMQWDDPFDVPGGITTEYNYFVFDGEGNYQDDQSSYGGAFTTNRPLRLPRHFFNPLTPYQIVITKSGQTNGDLAKHLRLRYSNGTITPPFILNVPLDPNAPTTFGHTFANGCTGVAAYIFDNDTPPRSSTNPPFSRFFTDCCGRGRKSSGGGKWEAGNEKG